MFRFFTIIFSLLAIPSLIFSTVVDDNNSVGKCLICHDEIYVKAMSYPNKHTVVKDGCTKCHYRESSEDKSMKMATVTFKQDIIFHLGNLQKENKKHLIRVDARDTDSNLAKPMIINTRNEEIFNYPEESYELKEISNIMTESVERSIFAKAVISWNTSVPTAFEVEYGTSKKKRNVLTSKYVYSREHKAVLTGLRHKSRYTFTITSMDMNGKTLRSEEQIFNTTKIFDLTNKETGPVNDPDLEPEIEDAVLLNIGERNDVFIRISSNEPVKFNLSVTDIEEKGTKPCDNLVETRTSTIIVCIECHAHESSHPVGIRSSKGTKTPEELPTIENGLITCVTCHFAHGGEADYFLRTKLSEDLCIKCHQETPKNDLGR